MLLSTLARRLAPQSRRSLSTAAAAASEPSMTHQELHDAVTAFINTEINPNVDRWEEEGIFPAKELFKKMGDAGFLGVTKPTEYGGLGLDFSYGIAMAEAMGQVSCGAIPMAVGVQTDMATPALAKFGSDAVREQFLAPSVAGDYVACLGVSEAGAGSDVSAVVTTAVKDGDDYVINGGKFWTTNGTQADWMCLLANTSDGAPHKNKSLICMPMDLPGVTVAPRFDKLGMRSSDTTQVFLEDVRIPQSYRIGDEGKGFMYQMIQFQEERLFCAANCLLGLEACIQQTMDYTKERKVFGAPVLDNQVVHFRLAELMTEVEALRALTYRARDEYIAGRDVTRLASMAKLKSGRLAREVTDSCLQFWGGMGFMSETPVSRAYRDLRLLSIGGGADEVMLDIISKLSDLK